MPITGILTAMYAKLRRHSRTSMGDYLLVLCISAVINLINDNHFLAMSKTPSSPLLGNTEDYKITHCEARVLGLIKEEADGGRAKGREAEGLGKGTRKRERVKGQGRWKGQRDKKEGKSDKRGGG